MKKKKHFGKGRGFTVDSNPGAVLEELRKNERLRERVALRRKAKGQRPDTNNYVPLEEA